MSQPLTTFVPILITIIISLWIIILPYPREAQSTKPNIVLILTDNMGWGDLGVYGGGVLRGAVRRC